MYLLLENPLGFLLLYSVQVVWPGLGHMFAGRKVKFLSDFMKCTPNRKEGFFVL